MVVSNKVRATGIVYETDDYSIFKKLPANRDLIAKRLKRLIESFSEKEILNPIVVNGKYEIIDGQGRFEAKKSLGLPIQFVIDEDADIDDCRRMNAYNAPWNIKDYAKSLADDGNDNCRRLLDCCSELNVSINRCLRLTNHAASKKTAKGSDLQLARLESLVFTEEDCKVARDICKKINEIREALILTKQMNEAFCTAVKVMSEYDGYDHNSMLRRCEKERNRFSLASNLGDMLREFSRIYNISRQANKKLYFEDYMRNKGYNVRDYVDEKDTEDVSTLRKNKRR